MAGVLFVVCVPTSEHEASLTENLAAKGVSSSSTSEEFIKQFTDSKLESLQSLRTAVSTTDSLCETDDTNISYVSKTPKECSTTTLNSDGNNQERSTTDGVRVSKPNLEICSEKPCEITVKNEETDHHEQLPEVTKKNAADLTEVQCCERTVPMKKVSRSKG
jgi:hypothetical protein